MISFRAKNCHATVMGSSDSSITSAAPYSAVTAALSSPSAGAISRKRAPKANDFRRLKILVSSSGSVTVKSSASSTTLRLSSGRRHDPAMQEYGRSQRPGSEVQSTSGGVVGTSGSTSAVSLSTTSEAEPSVDSPASAASRMSAGSASGAASSAVSVGRASGVTSGVPLSGGWESGRSVSGAAALPSVSSASVDSPVSAMSVGVVVSSEQATSASTTRLAMELKES